MAFDFTGLLEQAIAKDPLTDPQTSLQTTLPQLAETFALQLARNQDSSETKNDLNNVISYLQKNGISSSDIQTQINNGINDSAKTLQISQTNQGGGGFIDQITSNPLAMAEIAAAFAIPALAEYLAPSLIPLIAEATGVTLTAAQSQIAITATLSAAEQIATGVPVQKALQNAAISALVAGASPAVAQTIYNNGNGLITSPSVINAIVSGGASAVTALAKGATVEQALQDAGAAVAASGIQTGSAFLAGQQGVTPDKLITNILSGATQGYLQAGGNTFTALAGAASGAGRNSDDTLIASKDSSGKTIYYDAKTGNVYNWDGSYNADSSNQIKQYFQGQQQSVEVANKINNMATPQGYVPLNIVTDNQVAGPGGLPNLPPGTTNIVNGQAFFTYVDASGATQNLPVVIDQASQKIFAASGTAADEQTLLQQFQKYGISVGTIANDVLQTFLNQAQSMYGDTVNKVLSPGYISQAEGDMLSKGFTKQQVNQIANEVQAASTAQSGTTDEASKFATLLKEAVGSANPSAYLNYISALGVNIPSALGLGIRAALFTPDLNSGEDAQLAQILKASNIAGPFDPGKGNGWDASTGLNSTNVPTFNLPDVVITAARQLPENESIIFNIDPATNMALVIDSKGKTSVAPVPTGSNKGDVINFTDTKNPVNVTQTNTAKPEVTSVINKGRPAPIPGVGTTPAITPSPKILPNESGSVETSPLPPADPSASTNKLPQIVPNEQGSTNISPEQKPSEPTPPGGQQPPPPPPPPPPEGSTQPPQGPTPPAGKPPTGTPGGEPPPETTPPPTTTTPPPTETTLPPPTYTPNLFIEGLVPAGLKTLNGLTNIPKGLTGQTQGLSGGAGVELDPSTGKKPQLVWGDRYASLKEGLNA